MNRDAFLLPLLLAAGSAAAQVAPAPTPAQLQPPTREEIERVPRADRAPLPPARLTITGGVEHSPCALDAPRFAAVTMTLKEVVFDDLKGVDADTLRPAWQGMIGQTVPIAAVCSVRDAAATILRRQGFLAAVQVPPQRIEGGVLHLQVLMARLVAVHVRGDAGHAERAIAGYLRTLQGDKPFNQRDAERALLLAGDLPGFDVRLSLRPAGTVPGEVVGDVTVVRTPWQVNVNVQNYGSRAIGRFAGLATLEADDLAGLGDRAIFGFYNTADVHEQSVVQASEEIRPGSSGVSLAGRFTYAWTRPDTGNGDPLRARTAIVSVEGGYPVVLRQAASLRAAAGLDLVDQKLSFGGLPFTDDRLRVLYARVDFGVLDPASASGEDGYSASEPRWRASGALEVRQGLAALGASARCGPAPLYAGCTSSPTPSRIDGDPAATLLRFGATFAFKPERRVTLAISPRAQVASAPLLSYEQFSAGNFTVGRGYDPGALSGDSGLGVQAEVRVGSLIARAADRVAVQPFVFVDAARTWENGSLAAAQQGHIVSAGGGVRAAWGNRALIDLAVAAPLATPPLATSRGGVRLLLSLTTHFSGGRE